MLGALKDLLNSEKAVASGALAICATVLVALGHISGQDWIDYTKWVLVTYVAGKTITSGVAMVTKTPDTSSTAATEEPK